MPSARPPPKILPLRWVVVAIVVFIAGYTFLRLHYGKRDRSFEPYHDLGERFTVEHLLAQGYHRIPVTIQRPAEPLPADRLAPAPAEVLDTLGGLPAEIRGALAFPPTLPDAITLVTAPRAVAPAADYRLQFACAQPDNSTQIRDAYLYRKDQRLYLVPDFEKLTGQLLARSRDSTVLASFSTQGLAPGRYTLVLCGGRRSKSWSFVVR
jgi:hypothetical protein